jgi:hypothetical protein
LQYIFALISAPHKTCVEICAGDGIECNTANLIISHGWRGLLVDGNARNIRKAKAFYGRHKDTRQWPPVVEHAWVTAETVNALVSRAGFEGEIDLLSLDMDGVDYWVWRALDVIRPRVVVAEYNNLWPPEESVTIPYESAFVARRDQDQRPGDLGAAYAGASLGAMAKLAREKGYRLVGVERLGYNAFFVRADIGADLLPEVPVSACQLQPHVARNAAERLESIRHRQWVRV